MAKLTAHGPELVRLEFPTYRAAYMRDGKVLRNYGSGWKLHGTVKRGVAPADHAANMQRQYDARTPEYHRYIAALKDAVSMERRAMLHTAIAVMPEDPDGVYSAMDDRSWHDGPEIGECVELCRLYLAAIAAQSAPTPVPAQSEVA